MPEKAASRQLFDNRIYHNEPPRPKCLPLPPELPGGSSDSAPGAVEPGRVTNKQNEPNSVNRISDITKTHEPTLNLKRTKFEPDLNLYRTCFFGVRIFGDRVPQNRENEQTNPRGC